MPTPHVPARPVTVSVLTSGHDVADARLHREVGALQRAGARVEVLGLGSADDAPDGARVRTWRRGSLPARAVHALTLPWRASGSVVVTLDPELALSARWWRRAGRGRRLVADVHEDYLRLLRDRPWIGPASRRVAEAVAALAVRAAAGADLTTVADDHLPPHAPRRRWVLRNLPDTRLLPAGPPARDARPRAAYVGDLRASRGLFAMVEAVRQAPGWTLDLVGPVSAADRGRLDRLLAQDDLSERVRLHGRLAPRAAWEVAAGAWVGMLLLEDTPAFRDALPSKVHEYLWCAMAVLTTDLPRQAGLVRDSGAGVVVADAEQAGAALRAWSDDPAAVAALGDRAAAWAREHLDDDAYDAWGRAVVALAGAAR